MPPSSSWRERTDGQAKSPWIDATLVRSPDAVLQDELKKSHMTPFEIASSLEYSDGQIAEMQEFLTLTKASAKAKVESAQRPSLVAPEQSCPPSSKLAYEPAKPIEAICPSAQATPTVMAFAR